ncbi:DUF4440 domain-containing protein [Herbidospora sp. NEAU-GS84]|uniref:DUF4440 domain-containing protein n=1 Tax=Herbidospora solisilvae TaxID=2696284 RepID=A0A7C9J5U2_9ACTN|nr:nuclear transport factor 2 family protein [Herbidospora solisilvae]NAS24620.1 DUF4440 domain-containing protein [Herbidospora solisilvae]
MADVVQVVHDFFDAYNNHDLDALARFYASDAVSTAPGGVGEGRDQIISYHAHIWEAFPDARNTTYQTIEDGDVVAALAAVSGTHRGPFLLAGGEVVPATGRRVHVQCCWIFTVESGLIVTHRLYWDQLEAYAQLGILPT